MSILCVNFDGTNSRNVTHAEFSIAFDMVEVLTQEILKVSNGITSGLRLVK